MTFIVNRYSNHTEGVATILSLEDVNVLERARGIDSEVNEYLNLSYQDSRMDRDYTIYNVINETTIDYYNSQYDGKGTYLAYAWSIENLTFSENVISEILEDIQLVDVYLYNRLDIYRYHNWSLEDWTISQDINEIQLSSGWFIFQRLEYGVGFSLGGDGIYLTQISIIDENMNMLWMASDVTVWIA
jgi:hypothetical protein